MRAVIVLQVRLTRPDGTVLATQTVPDGWSVVNWGVTEDGDYWVGTGTVPAFIRPPWKLEQRTLPDGPWVTLAESPR